MCSPLSAGLVTPRRPCTEAKFELFRGLKEERGGGAFGHLLREAAEQKLRPAASFWHRLLDGDEPG